MDFKEVESNISLVSEKETKASLKDNFEIDFWTAYVEFVDGKYNIYTPDDDMKDGYDSYTGERLYDLNNNQFHAIIMKCKVYNYLIDNALLHIEAEIEAIFPEKYKDDDSYLFLFQDTYNYEYERQKIYNLINAEDE